MAQSVDLPADTLDARFDRHLVLVCAHSLIYFCAATLGIQFLSQPENIAIFWPVSGVTLGLLVLTARRDWGWALLGAGLGNVAVNLLVNKSFLVSLGLAGANIVEAVLGAYLLGVVLEGNIGLSKPWKVFAFLGVGTIVAAASGVLGASVITLSVDGEDFGLVWRAWWLADALGVLLVAPAILSLSQLVRDWEGHVSGPRLVELLCWFVLLFILGFRIFGSSPSEYLGLFSQSFLLFPVMLGVAVRLGRTPTSLATAFLSVVALLSLDSSMTTHHLLLVQGFLGVLALSSYVLAVNLEEQNCSQKEVLRLNEDLESTNSSLQVRLDDLERADAVIRESLAEKESMLQEIHHRVKNNLAVIVSLFHLQSTTEKDPHLLQVLTDCQQRVRAMGLVHESLYRSANLSAIDLGNYADSLARQLHGTCRLPTQRIELETRSERVFVSVEFAVPAGLILNELVGNALKHAFRDRDRGALLVGVRPLGEEIEILVEDDGVGLPEGVDRETRTLGMRLVRVLTKQLRGALAFEQSTSGGTRALVRFPATRPSENGK